MTRYFGVFASRHHLRPCILPPSVVPASGQQLALALDDDDSRGAAAEPSARPRRIGWANLLARVFAVAVTVCRKCGGRIKPSSPTTPAKKAKGAKPVDKDEDEGSE